MRNGRSEVRLAGAGGQGIITAGIILAEAAVLSGRNATQSQVFGPEARGGASRTDVVIADGEIGFPVPHGLDVLVALTEEACQRYVGSLRPGSLLLVDDPGVPEPADGPWERRALPIVDAAQSVTGSALSSGVVALGVLLGLTGVVDREALEQAVTARVPARSREVNLRALAAGIELAGEG